MTAPAPGPSALAAFVQAVARLDATRGPRVPPIATEIARVAAGLRDLPVPAAPLQANDHPVLAHLGAALDRAAIEEGSAAVVVALHEVGAWLPWRYGYPPRTDLPDLGRRIAFAEVVGPGAPIESARICLGVTLIAPGTLYPDHHHPAIELYRVLAGTATWTEAGRSRRVPPLEYVLHPSGVVHAMETQDEPLLAVYSWTGEDVRTTSTYAVPALRTSAPGGRNPSGRAAP